MRIRACLERQAGFLNNYISTTLVIVKKVFRKEDLKKIEKNIYFRKKYIETIFKYWMEFLLMFLSSKQIPNLLYINVM